MDIVVFKPKNWFLKTYVCLHVAIVMMQSIIPILPKFKPKLLYSEPK